MARPTKLTPEVQQRIVQALELGATYAHAAQYGGVSYDAMNDWMRKNSQFLQAVKGAEAKAVMLWLAKIEKAASDGNWQAAAWKLERRFPAMYGRTIQQQEHRGAIQVVYVNDWRSRYVDVDLLSAATPDG